MDIIEKMFAEIDNLRPKFQKSPIAMDLNPPDEYELKWGSHKVLKADTFEDEENIQRIKADRWLPVAPCMYPELPSLNGRIECDGLVLYMRTIESPRDLNNEILKLESQIRCFQKKIKKEIIKYLNI